MVHSMLNIEGCAAVLIWCIKKLMCYSTFIYIY
jgi:hypothetical protein